MRISYNFTNCCLPIQKICVTTKNVALHLIEKLRTIWDQFLNLIKSCIKGNNQQANENFSKQANNFFAQEENFKYRARELINYPTLPSLDDIVIDPSDEINKQLDLLSETYPLIGLDKYAKVISYTDAVKLLGPDFTVIVSRIPETQNVMVFRSSQVFEIFDNFLEHCSSKQHSSPGHGQGEVENTYRFMRNDELEPMIKEKPMIKIKYDLRGSVPLPTENYKKDARCIIFDQNITDDMVALFSKCFSRNDASEIIKEMEITVNKVGGLSKPVAGLITEYLIPG